MVVVHNSWALGFGAKLQREDGKLYREYEMKTKPLILKTKFWNVHLKLLHYQRISCIKTFKRRLFYFQCCIGQKFQTYMREESTNRSSFCYHLSVGACEKCQKFLVLDEILPSNSKSTNFGSIFAHLTVFQKVKLQKKIILSSFCYRLSGVACEKFQKFLVLSENTASNSTSTNFGSVSASSDSPPKSEFLSSNFFWVAFGITFRVGHVKNIRTFWFWTRFYRLT